MSGPASPEATEDLGDGTPRGGLTALFAARFTTNVALRFTFSFVAPVARGLGVSVDQLGLALGLRELTGLAAPAFGRRSDAAGHRRTSLVAGLGVASIALFLTAITANLLVVTIGLVLFGLGKVAHDTSSNGWLGDHVPYARRGRATGLLELSWALALVVGIPIMGLLLEATSWRAPFFVCSAAVAICAVMLDRVLNTHPRMLPPPPPDVAPAPATWRQRLPRGDTRVVIIVMSAIMLSIQLVTVVFGVWLEDEFGFSVAAVGTASILLGLGEVVGAGGSARFTDRWGKPRSVLIGMVPMVPCLALLGFASASTPLVLGLFAIVSVGFEFSFVSALPLLTELEPDARAATVGQAFAGFTFTRAIGTVLGAFAYVRFGMTPVALAAAAVTAAAIVLLLRRRMV